MDKEDKIDDKNKRSINPLVGKHIPDITNQNHLRWKWVKLVGEIPVFEQLMYNPTSETSTKLGSASKER